MKKKKIRRKKKGLNLIINSIFLFKLILRNLKIYKIFKNFDFSFIFFTVKPNMKKICKILKNLIFFYIFHCETKNEKNHFLYYYFSFANTFLVPNEALRKKLTKKIKNKNQKYLFFPICSIGDYNKYNSLKKSSNQHSNPNTLHGMEI